MCNIYQETLQKVFSLNIKTFQPGMVIQTHLLIPVFLRLTLEVSTGNLSETASTKGLGVQLSAKALATTSETLGLTQVLGVDVPFKLSSRPSLSMSDWEHVFFLMVLGIKPEPHTRQASILTKLHPQLCFGCFRKYSSSFLIHGLILRVKWSTSQKY